jgi:topoisomerase IV subunit A
MARFKLSDEQAEAILETKLRHLAKLEEMKIRGEQAGSSPTSATNSKLLKSKARLKKLVAEELEADAEKYGDARRSKIIEREAAQAIDETELIANEPTRSCCRRAASCAPRRATRSTRARCSTRRATATSTRCAARRTQQAVFLDSTGRSYCLAAHTLPSARGQGEPLSGRLNPPDGAKFAGVMMGEPEDLWLLASDAGYGFTVRLKELITDRRAGKSVLTVPEGSLVLPPAPVLDANSLVAVATNEGRLLVFKVADVPELPKGKGNKLFNVPAKAFETREEFLAGVAVVAPGGKLLVHTGDRKMTLDWADLKPYRGERAQRGAVLPRGWRGVTRLEAGGE